MGSSCKVLVYFNLQLQGLGLFFSPAKHEWIFFYSSNLILSIINICLLLDNLCSRIEPAVEVLISITLCLSFFLFHLSKKAVWTCTLVEAGQGPLSQSFRYCQSKDKQSLSFCCRTIFSMILCSNPFLIFFFMVVLLTLSFSNQMQV